MSASDVLKSIKENNVKFVDFRFVDTKGKEQRNTSDHPGFRKEAGRSLWTAKPRISVCANTAQMPNFSQQPPNRCGGLRASALPTRFARTRTKRNFTLQIDPLNAEFMPVAHYQPTPHPAACLS